MGWSQYIVIDELKLMIEISRYVKENDIEFIAEDLRRLQDINRDLPEDAFEENWRNVSIKEMSQYIYFAEKTRGILIQTDEYFLEYMLLIFLRERKIPFRIITDTSDDFKKINNYKMIKIYRGE